MKILSKTLSIFCLIAVPVLASATSSKCMENWLARPEVQNHLANYWTLETSYYPDMMTAIFQFEPWSDDDPHAKFWFIDKNGKPTPIAIYIRIEADLCHCSSDRLQSSSYTARCMRGS